MKMLIAIVQDEDVSRLVNELMNEGYYITKLATTGGFLRAGNTTLLLGVEEDRLQGALSIIERTCESRKQFAASPPPLGASSAFVPYPVEVTVGGANIFVLQVDQNIRY